ncbi:hypothetical protein NP493_1363g00045 [Ridgeia piscesae]|uniref:Uncharacterized protein n=1 Tax=Ridgeia piscesae TaxID=27915 RepID=A0AAD9K5X9_RIDPI|nr:hypothetical protein NP493_1363g00045 [Ridgeia piscesae]
MFTALGLGYSLLRGWGVHCSGVGVFNALGLDVHCSRVIKRASKSGAMLDIVDCCSMLWRLKMEAYSDGEFAKAVDFLNPVRYKVLRIGGSNAQMSVTGRVDRHKLG